ncbi:MAG TPA: dihydropteroate synthase, partial [Opitutae bacterium]|nr:dihydropteroate synthase [Opitutae bacterium]
MGEKKENRIPLDSTKLKLGEGSWSIGEQTGVVGILNVTPDSFADGGEYADFELAVLKGKDLADQGADIVDIGGESTRPGYEEVSIDEEISRVVPVIVALSSQESFPPISIDTTKID